MRKSTKKTIRRASVVAVSGALIVGLLTTTFGNDVQAATRLYGVQQVVQDLEESDSAYNILEIVPDTALASMGFFAGGSDAVIDSKYLDTAKASTTETTTTTITEARKAAAQAVIDSMDSSWEAKLNSYTEQLYVADNDTSVWNVIDKTGENYSETRTGHFAEAESMGVSAGNYGYSKKVFLTLELVDEDGNIVDVNNANFQPKDKVTLRLTVSSGRKSTSDDLTPIFADITLYGNLNGTDFAAKDTSTGLTAAASDAAADADTSLAQIGTFHISNIYDLATNGDGIYDFTYTITEADAAAGGLQIYAKAEANTTNNDDYGIYSSNELSFTYGEKSTITENVDAKTQDISVETSYEDTSESTTSEEGTTETTVTRTYTVTLSADSEISNLTAYSDVLVDTTNANGKIASEITWTQDEATKQYTGSFSYSYIVTDAEKVPVLSFKTDAMDNAASIEIETDNATNTGTGSITVTTEKATTKDTDSYKTAVTSTQMTEKTNFDDYRYTEDLGRYVWVDGTDTTVDQTAKIPVGKIYYKTNITCKNVFAESVLDLVAKTETAANDQAAIDHIHVYTYTPDELESALINGIISLSDMDLVYISNSGILDTTGLTTTDSTGNAVSRVATYGTDNDLSWQTAFNIYEYMANINLPVIMDHSIFSDASADGTANSAGMAIDKNAMVYNADTTASATDTGSNLLRLAYLLRRYTVDGVKAVTTEDDGDVPGSSIWTSDFIDSLMGVDKIDVHYGTYGLVSDCIYINNDAAQGNLAKTAITKEIFTYKSTDSNNGESVVSGMENVVNEIANDNFYNITNKDDYTIEYTEDGDDEIITVSQATLVKYIINFNQRRITLYKDSINVLDIEPTKYSELSEDDIRGWLGIKSGFSTTVSDQDSTLSYTLSDNAGAIQSNNDFSYTYYHTWSSSNKNCVTVNGSGNSASFQIVGTGTSVVTHKYEAYDYSIYNYRWIEEKITFTVTNTQASETQIKEINITQMSTSELAGKMEDLIENYDMIYIGSCIGPNGANGSLYQNSYGQTTYNDSNLDGKIYLHTGDIAVAYRSGVNGDGTTMRGLLKEEDTSSVTSVTNRYAGNDITEDKYNELLEYAQAGYPIVVDSKLYDGSTVSTKYLDNSSYIYKLITAVAGGFENKEEISKSDYEAAVEKYGDEETAEENGYSVTRSYTYTHYWTEYPLGSYTVEKVTDFSSLNKDAAYLIASANTNGGPGGGKSYNIVSKDLTLSSNLKNTLQNATDDKATIDAETWEKISGSDYLWYFEADGYEDVENHQSGMGQGSGKNDKNNKTYTRQYKYKIRNASNEYLYFYNYYGNIYPYTHDSSTELRVWSGSVSGSCYIFDNYYEAYLKASGNSSSVTATTSSGSDTCWYLYKVTEIPATGSGELKSESISEADYNKAVQENGNSEVFSSTEEYYTKTLVSEKFYYTSVTEGLSNVISGSSSGTTLNRLVKYINMPRLNLVMTSVPTEYTSTANASTGALEEFNSLQQENGKYYLSYEFEFSNTAESASGESTYSLSLYVDVNADGRYVPAEELDGVDVTDSEGNTVDPAKLKSGVRYKAKRELPQDYVGLLPWKFIISLNTASGKSTVRASQIGYTNVLNNSGDSTPIKVLQIIPVAQKSSYSSELVPDGLDLTDTSTWFPSLINSVNTKLKYNIQITLAYPEDCTDKYGVRQTGINTLAAEADSAEEFFEDYLDQYDMIIWGYSDMYCSNDFVDNAIDAFAMFIESGKSVLFSHDLTSFNNGWYTSGSNRLSVWGYNINQYLRSIAGMDRYGITTDKGKSGSLSELLSSQTSNSYNLTENMSKLIAAANKDTASKPTTDNDTTDTYKQAQGFTDSFLNNQVANYHKSGTSEQYSVYYDGSQEGSLRTTEISETNEGQITRYPFDITIEDTDSSTGETYMQRRTSYSSDYYVEEVATTTVGTTHFQYYQLDFNYDTDGDGTNNLVVWYSLAGDGYDTVPNDARNNYYIYSVGNITYTGMGHSYSSSDKKGAVSLKEAQLFVNTIVAAYNAGIKKPSVNIVKNSDSKNTSIEYIYRTFDETKPSDNTSDETFAFYVNDTNMIQGTKTITTFFCKEIDEAVYETNAGKDGYYEITSGGKTVYLKRYTEDELKDILVSYDKTVSNNVTSSVTVKADWINTVLKNNTSEGSRTLWIGAYTTLKYSSSRDDATTEPVFDSITFKRRNLTDLD